MASSCEKLDQLVKDYLLFRGFSVTLKTFDQELKTDKDKSLRVDRMMEQIWTLLASYDLAGLRDYWRYLSQRLFSRLDHRYAHNLRKLESSLLKLYVVNAYQCGKPDKVRAFFEQLGVELQSHTDFKDWFAFPFISNPADNPTFSMYFNKQWQDTLQLSLHNFLSVVLQAMPVPTLLNVEFDARRMKTLQEENTALKQQLMNNSSSVELGKEMRTGSRRNIQTEFHPPSSPPDMVYDFSGLADDPESSTQEKQKAPRRFPLSLTSPLSGRKKSTDYSQTKPKLTSTGLLGITTTPASFSSSGTHNVSSSSSNSYVKPITQRKTTELAVFPPSSVRPSIECEKQHTAPLPTVTGNTMRFQLSNRQTSLPAGVTSATNNSRQIVKKNQNTLSAGNASKPQSNNYEPQSTTATGQSSLQRATSVVDNTKPTISRNKSPVFAKQTNVIEVSGTSNLQSEPRALSGETASAYASCTSVPVVTDTISQNAAADSPFLLLEDEYIEHSSAASYCRFSPTGQYIASLDVDGVVKVWMWSPQPATTATIMSRTAFLSLTWLSKWDRWLLLGNKTGSIRLFDVKESKTYREVQVHPDNPTNCMRVTDMSTSPSSNHFVSASANLCPFTCDLNSVNGRLLQWDLKTLKVERALLVDSDICNAVTCSCYSQSSQLITGGADGFLRLYDKNQQKSVMKWKACEGPIHTVAFEGENYLYSMGADGKLCKWNLSQVSQSSQPIISLSVGSNDSLKIASGSGSCRGHLFSLDSDGQYLLTYKGNRGVIHKTSESSSPMHVMDLKYHQAQVVTVDWSPSQNTKVCLTGAADGRIKISTLLSK